MAAIDRLREIYNVDDLTFCQNYICVADREICALRAELEAARARIAGLETTERLYCTEMYMLGKLNNFMHEKPMSDYVLPGAHVVDGAIKSLTIMRDRIAELENATIAQSEEVQRNWASPYEVAGMKQRIAELEAAQRWIPVGARLPEIGVEVMTYNAKEKEMLFGWLDPSKVWRFEFEPGCVYAIDVTHWMPKPPEAA